MNDNIKVSLGSDGYLITASLYKDGDQWCVAIGEMPSGLFGFGYTVGDAVAEFKGNCRNRNNK